MSLLYFMTAWWSVVWISLVYFLNWNVRLSKTFPVVLSKLLVHLSWPGAAKGRMPIQRLGGTTGPDYEWDWPWQIWVTKSRAGEPHARWWSLAKGHLWLISRSPDGPHSKQRHWPSFLLGWENAFNRGPERGSDVSYTFWQEVEGCQRVSDLKKLI